MPSRSRLLTTAVTAAAIGIALAGAASPAGAIEPSDSEVFATALAFDGQAGPPTATSQTVTLPLHTGVGPDGGPVYYIVTESSNATDAAALGVNYSPKLANALGTKAVQGVTVARNGKVHFAGTVDFSPRRQVVPGPPPNTFPPTTATPGSVADAKYSPLTTDGDGTVVNMPQISNLSGRSDSVVSIDHLKQTVTLSLFGGFYDDHQVLYVRTEASAPDLAAIESSTYAPNLSAAPGLASDDPATSAREAIVPIVNGPTGVSNPSRQGLNSALAGEGAPLNIIQEDPAPPSDDSSRFYSPVWDVTPGQWTQTAIAAGLRKQLRSITAVHNASESASLLSYASGQNNPEVGLNASGWVSLCPVIAVLPIPNL